MPILKQDQPDAENDPALRSRKKSGGARRERRVPLAFEEKIYRSAPLYRQDKGGNTAWPLVFLLLVLVPPLGAVFVWRKLSYEKMRAHRNGEVLAIFGAVVTVLVARWPLGELVFLLRGKSQAGSITFILVLGSVSLVGIGIILLGIKISRAGELDLYLLYLIREKKITDLPTLAEMAGLSYKTLTLKLEKLIDGPLQDAYIYHRDKVLIVPGISERIACFCRQCGGTTVLYVNEERICDYCGAPL